MVAAEARQQHPVRGWVTLLDPPQQSLVVLPTRKPRFAWSQPTDDTDRGPLGVRAQRDQHARRARETSSPLINDTTYVFPDSLESNTSYRWQVRAHAQRRQGQRRGDGDERRNDRDRRRPDLHAALSEFSKPVPSRPGHLLLVRSRETGAGEADDLRPPAPRGAQHHSRPARRRNAAGRRLRPRIRHQRPERMRSARWRGTARTTTAGSCRRASTSRSFARTGRAITRKILFRGP